MKRKQLNNKEIRELNESIKAKFGLDDFFSKKDHVEFRENQEKLVIKDDQPFFSYTPQGIIPTLHIILKNNFLKTITIDMPAVKFIANGADIMRPGIVATDDFKENDIIAIVDEKNKKPLAIGQALFSSEQIKSMQSGKVIKNIHYVGDRIWTTKSAP